VWTYQVSEDYHSNSHLETSPQFSKGKILPTEGYQELAEKETRAVNCLKIVLCAILLLSAAGVATFVYIYTSRDETDEFQESFTELSKLIIDSVQTNAQNRVEAVGALAAQIQAFAISSNATWPFVTIPFFEEQINVVKSLKDAYGVLLFPIVADTLRAEWENYTLENVQWVSESFATQTAIYGENGQLLPGPDESWFDVLWGEGYESPKNPDFSAGIGDRIFQTSDPDDDESNAPIIHVDTIDGLYFPQWQVAPMSWYYQSTVNLNYGQWDNFLNSTLIIMETGNAVLGVTWTDGAAPGLISTMLYPIFRQFYHGDEHDEKTVVAFLGADIFWEDYLTHILPENTNGIYVVIENTFDQVFTYQLSGEDVAFVGGGDLHDKTYDSMVQTSLFGEHLQEPVTSESYAGAPLYGGFIQYTFRIYPSQDLEDKYVTPKPIIYTVMACVIFLLTSLIFVMYDCLVEKRQKLVMTTAIKSDDTVSSLFPSNVKARLYRGDEEDHVVGKKDHPDSDSDEGDMMTKLDSPLAANHKEGPPIAELYENATVFFAGTLILSEQYFYLSLSLGSKRPSFPSDIAGFTAWSFGRPPVDVFMLLETIYGAFDQIAKKRSVFKVETIGDCYVAVTGVPVPQDDHAVIMAKFARDVLKTLKEELKKLEHVLGSETLHLAMRVGLHSGPVTAGVLRGEKARFQLFGDTMNTAARMESNSARNRIHVSEATANLLIEAGKSSWVTKRQDDTVVAKGKGEMQTYWVERGRFR
jgi:class 3 adenylate cyclase